MAFCVSEFSVHFHYQVSNLRGRHSLYQLQAVAAELLGQFEFALPEDMHKVLRVPGGTMVPMVEGKDGVTLSAMPLRVSLAQ